VLRYAGISLATLAVGGGIGGKGGHKRRSATFSKVHGHEILSIENLKPPLNEKIGPLI
jgi:hypothetical protein